VVEVAPETAVLQPATTGVAIVVVVVGSVETGGADALVPSAETVITPVMANRAVVNFLDDMTYFLNELYIW
jgi:hypothetical protein